MAKQLNREMFPNAEQFASLIPYVAEAREMEKEMCRKQPLRNEASLSWDDNRWVLFIVNAVRIYDRTMGDKEMAERPADVWAVFKRIFR
jgi:hypothetical protein